MDADEFEARAGATLERLMDRIEAAAGDVWDVDLEGGILTIGLPGGGQYLLNRHAPTRELWMSSPASGAAHFAWDAAGGCWRDTRGGGTLDRRLEGELSRALGRSPGIAEDE